jgi:hypothetical protein
MGHHCRGAPMLGVCWVYDVVNYWVVWGRAQVANLNSLVNFLLVVISVKL